MKSLSLSSLLVASASIIALACSVAPAALPAPSTVVPVALEPVVTTPVAVATAPAAPASDCVTGEPFAAQTAWHARDVVFMTTRATVL